jgi:hypothetical protein
MMISHFKKKRVKNPHYLRFIREQSCVACGAFPKSQAHHCYAGGTGTKCNDMDTIPLCGMCHRILHDQGKKTFLKLYSLPDYADLISEYQEKYKNKGKYVQQLL